MSHLSKQLNIPQVYSQSFQRMCAGLFLTKETTFSCTSTGQSSPMVKLKWSAPSRAAAALLILESVFGIAVANNDGSEDWAFAWFLDEFSCRYLPCWERMSELCTLLLSYRNGLPDLSLSARLGPQFGEADEHIDRFLTELFTPCATVIPGIGTINQRLGHLRVIQLYELAFTLSKLKKELPVRPHLLPAAYVASVTGALMLYCLALSVSEGVEKAADRIAGGLSHQPCRPLSVDCEFVAYRLITGRPPSYSVDRREMWSSTISAIFSAAMMEYGENMVDVPDGISTIRSTLLSQAKKDENFPDLRLPKELPEGVSDHVQLLYDRLEMRAHRLLRCIEEPFFGSTPASEVIREFCRRRSVLRSVPLPAEVRTAIYEQIEELIACFMIIFYGFGANSEAFWCKVLPSRSTRGYLHLPQEDK
jgi:hypothetical protein